MLKKKSQRKKPLVSFTTEPCSLADRCSMYYLCADDDTGCRCFSAKQGLLLDNYPTTIKTTMNKFYKSCPWCYLPDFDDEWLAGIPTDKHKKFKLAWMEATDGIERRSILKEIREHIEIASSALRERNHKATRPMTEEHIKSATERHKEWIKLAIDCKKKPGHQKWSAWRIAQEITPDVSTYNTISDKTKKPAVRTIYYVICKVFYK